VEGFTDANRARSPSYKRSTTKYCTFLGGNLVTWSKKHNVVARSSAGEYRAMAHIASEPTWLQHFLKKIGFPTLIPIPLFCDKLFSELTWLQHFLKEIGFPTLIPIPLFCDKFFMINNFIERK
jgi:hypothetical protein